MATLSVSYSQGDDIAVPGVITLNGESRTASGRLDSIGDVVVATGFAFSNYTGSVECERTSATEMRVTVLLEDAAGYYGYYSYTPYECQTIERVVEGVPLEF